MTPESRFCSARAPVAAKGIGTSLETTQIGTAPVHGNGLAQEVAAPAGPDVTPPREGPPRAEPTLGRSFGGALAGYALWVLFWALVALWAAFLWHPWIDWFGRVRLAG